MCGFAGFIDSDSEEHGNLLRRVSLMTTKLRHRGPDDNGTWVDVRQGIALGHARLSIIDLSPMGHQPMESANGRYVIAYNGEVYNFGKIKKELLADGYGPAFKGSSDTEIILSAIETWGIKKAVSKFVGMFAFALWDRREKQITLCRDRLGKKPLYYGYNNNLLYFASELKAIRADNKFRPEIDRDALAFFMRYSYIVSPYSIYKNIFKLLPGTFITIKAENKNGDLPEPIRYWSALKAYEDGAKKPLDMDDDSAISALDDLLTQAVDDRKISDVPLGALLSGGIDSSAIVALMQKNAVRPTKTFSIGFDEKGYNEAGYAKEVARHLGTEHTELYVTSREALDVIPILPTLYDEPFADSSQIPTFLVSKMAREHVTVALGGDGGDELFTGYHRYLYGAKLARQMSLVPSPLRAVAGMAIGACSYSMLGTVYSGVSKILPGMPPQPNAGDKLKKLAGIATDPTPENILRQLVSQWEANDKLVIGGVEPPSPLSKTGSSLRERSAYDRMSYIDTVSYLPDDIMAKVDRASMGVSLETRTPLLDHRLVEFAATLPTSMKVRNSQSKWLLRQVLFRYVPKKLIERPKVGFSIPFGEWIKDPLREWADLLLDKKRIENEGFLRADVVCKCWDEHRNGRLNWRSRLWNVLMFQAWLEKNG